MKGVLAWLFVMGCASLTLTLALAVAVAVIKLVWRAI